MPLLPGQSKQAWAFGRAALLTGLAWRERRWQPGGTRAGKRVSVRECHPGLVLSSRELQSRENDFCVKLFVGDGRARSACPIAPQAWCGQPAGCLPAPSAPPRADQEGSGRTDLLCARQARGREAPFEWWTCASRRAALLFRISLSCLPGFLTPRPVQAGHFASFQGATLCACWETLLSHLLRRPFSPVV